MLGNHQDAVLESENAAAGAASGRPILVAEELRKTYGARSALKGLSFSLTAGRILGFLGPNGAGKTTSISILTTILEPDSGHFTVDGIGWGKPDAIRRRIGVLPESFGLPKQMTGIEYVSYFGQLYGRSASDARSYGLALLEEVGWAGEVPGGHLQPGMRQRQHRARAHRSRRRVPRRPTIGLDPRGQEELLALVRQIATERSAGVILCSHLLAEVESVCDDVVILRSGEVVAKGTVSDVIGGTERNVVRVRVPEASVSASEQALAALPAVKQLADANGSKGWLRVQLDEAAQGDQQSTPAAGRTSAPASRFELRAEGGRLQDVFLHLTGGSTR
jgi:ABC-2 type transport system ATP-binding protein